MKRLAFLLGADDPGNIAQEAFVRLHDHWPSLAAAVGTVKATTSQAMAVLCAAPGEEDDR
jgi:hypothetical protein